MTRWIVGYCTEKDCRWVTAKLRQDRFTALDVTEAMIEHSETTGHHCRSRKHP
jgi:hypothetical protein